ncbi:MAG: pitrilysin family protein [Pseudomonadota bacterium]
MRTILMGALVSGALLLAAAPATAAANVERVVSDLGIEAYLLHEPSVPLIAMSFAFKGGTQFETAEQAGLAQMTAALLDEGAGELDSLAFRTALEDNAIQLSFNADRDAFVGDLRTLTVNKELAFDLTRLALTEVRFDAEPIERVRAQVMAVINRRSTDPGTVARETFFATAFPDHSYGVSDRGSLATVAALGRDDLVGFVDRQLTRDKLRIGVAGDITADELATVLDDVFGDLPAEGPTSGAEPVTPVLGSTVVVSQPVPQSVVMFGQGGVSRTDPDYYAAHVANYILGGGGFQSRLLKEIREKRGLAYSAYSYLLPTDLSPLWTGGVATNNEDVAESVRLIRQEVARLAAGDVTEDDLEGARTFLTGSFPLRLTSNAQVAGMLRGMAVLGLDVDYLERRNTLIDAVTLEDVKRVTRELLDPDDLLVVVVGDPQGLDG